MIILQTQYIQLGKLFLLYEYFLLTFYEITYLYHIFNQPGFTQKNTYESILRAPLYVFFK